MYMSQHEAEYHKQMIQEQIAPLIKRIEALEAVIDGDRTEYWRGQYDKLHAHIEQMRSAISSTDGGALRSTLEDIVSVYEWCSVDPVDRGYSALNNEIHRAKHLLASPSVPSPNQETGK